MEKGQGEKKEERRMENGKWRIENRDIKARPKKNINSTSRNKRYKNSTSGIKGIKIARPE